MSRLFAVIVTWNAMQNQWIDRCMDSLNRSTVAVTAIVVDNGSTDGTRDYVPNKWPKAVWLPQESNLGFGQANNIGIRYAMKQGADYVLLLNQDAALHPSALERMLEESDGESLLSPLHLNTDGTDFDYNFKRFTLALKPELPQTLDSWRQQHRARMSGEVCAACWLMPVSLLETVGGFNPLFFHYCEDSNYYDRMVWHNRHVLLVPGAEMYHDRKIYGHAELHERRQLRRQLLTIACDISQSGRACAKEMLWYLKDCYLRLLPRGRYVPGSFLINLLWLSSKWNAVSQSRRTEKQKGATWL